MSQHDYIIDNQSAPAARADINSALAAIVTQNSGATAPTTTYADMIWYDTANNQIKKRNEANSAWITLGTINEATGKFDPNASFTAVEQGGGAGMGTNKVRIGWGTSSNLIAQVDATTVGDLVRRMDSYTIGGNSELIAPGTPPLYAARSWVNFNGTGTVAVRASGNVSSITDNGIGNYTIAFSIAMPDANYVVSGSVIASFGGASLGTISQTASGVQIATSSSAGAFDPSQVHVVIHR